MLNLRNAEEDETGTERGNQKPSRLLNKTLDHSQWHLLASVIC
jgi:hypothetical protein